MRVYSYRGSVLFVDEETWELRHGPIASSPANAFWVGDGDRGRLIFARGMATRNTVGLPDHIQVADPSDGERVSVDPPVFECHPVGHDLVGLAVGPRYLCAEADGRLSLNRTHCRAWEHFRLLPHSDVIEH